MELEIIEILVSAGTSLIVAFLTIVAGFSTIQKRVRTELMAEFNSELRTERLQAYKKLWGKLDTVALYAPAKDLAYDSLEELSTELSKWYFEHGMYLTEVCRDHYFVLQDALVLMLNRAEKATQEEPYVLRARSRRLTMDELKREEKSLKLTGSRDPVTIRNQVLNRVGKDSTTDFYILRYVSSQLRTNLSKDLETREGLLAGIAADND